MPSTSRRRTIILLLSFGLVGTAGATGGCAKGTGTVEVSSAEIASSDEGTSSTTGAGASANDTAPDEPGTTEATVTATSRRSTTTSSTTVASSSSTTTTTSRSTSTTKKGSDTTLAPPVDQYATWCNTLRTGFMAISAMPTGTKAEEEALFVAAKALFSSLAQTAPAGVRQDWAVINEYFQTLTVTTAGTTPKPVSAAENRVEEWVKTNCGFDLNKL